MMTHDEIEMQVDEFMSMPWIYEVVMDEDSGDYVLKTPQLFGIAVQCDRDDTVMESMEHLRSVMRHWFEVRIEDGLDIPEPNKGRRC